MNELFKHISMHIYTHRVYVCTYVDTWFLHMWIPMWMCVCMYTRVFTQGHMPLIRKAPPIDKWIKNRFRHARVRYSSIRTRTVHASARTHHAHAPHFQTSPKNWRTQERWAERHTLCWSVYLSSAIIYWELIFKNIIGPWWKGNVTCCGSSCWYLCDKWSIPFTPSFLGI